MISSKLVTHCTPVTTYWYTGVVIILYPNCSVGCIFTWMLKFLLWRPKSRIFYMFVFYLFLKFLCLFLFESETEHEQGRGRERGKHWIRSRLQALSCQHRAWFGFWPQEPWDHDLSRSWKLNQLSHPGAPLFCYFLAFFSSFCVSIWMLS